MRNLTLSILFVVLLTGMLAVAYRKYQREVAVPQGMKAAAVIPAEKKLPIAPSPAPPEAVGAGAPLPPLAASDQAMREVLAGVFPGRDAAETWILDHFVERLVLLIDTLPRPALVIHRLPLQPPPGDFLVTGGGEKKIISEENYQRYSPLVRLLTAADTQKLVAAYGRYYPLFQEAYRDLGYPSEHFNRRLLAVIDHLLAAPEVAGPILLQRRGVRYAFADPELEALSAGQKILLRMGNENAGMLKEKLREMRRELITRRQGG
jgi:hypothetical protein